MSPIKVKIIYRNNELRCKLFDMFYLRRYISPRYISYNSSGRVFNIKKDAMFVMNSVKLGHIKQQCLRGNTFIFLLSI